LLIDWRYIGKDKRLTPILFDHFTGKQIKEICKVCFNKVPSIADDLKLKKGITNSQIQEIALRNIKIGGIIPCEDGYDNFWLHVKELINI
jgi:hypothetical protein